jgi:hypothetical protein
MRSQRGERAGPENSDAPTVGIEWAESGRTKRSRGGASETVERVETSPADRSFLERIYGAGCDGCVERYTSMWDFTHEDQARAVKAATSHSLVAPALEGRWSVLGADQVWTKTTARTRRQSVRVHIYNYTQTRMMDVLVEDDVVTSVDERGVHEYPESPQEIASAIEIARSHPALRDLVRDLVGHAILRVPIDEAEPSVARRCMWVMFTEPDDPTRELPTCAVALVDLGSMEVVGLRLDECAERDDDAREGVAS